MGMKELSNGYDNNDAIGFVNNVGAGPGGDGPPPGGGGAPPGGDGPPPGGGGAPGAP